MLYHISAEIQFTVNYNDCFCCLISLNFLIKLKKKFIYIHHFVTIITPQKKIILFPYIHILPIYTIVLLLNSFYLPILIYV